MLAYGINFTMRIITTISVIIIGIGILFYVAQESMSVHAVPTLQEYIASTTASSSLTAGNKENQASVAWLASSTIIDALLAPTSPEKNSSSTKIILPKNNSSLTPLKTSKGTLYVAVAKTPETRTQGLSGYTSLGADKGMLFIFPTPGEPDFWMKDMNFPLDMVWINSSRKIIGVSSNISPKTYPETFAPPGKIQFVLEVNAGIAEKFGMAVGTTVVF